MNIDINKELYKPFLASIDIYPDDTGVLHCQTLGSDKIWQINGKKVVLPTPENLKSLNNQEFIFFHPLSESIARGDSAVFRRLQTAVKMRINRTIYSIAAGLIKLAGDREFDGRLKSHQLPLLAVLPKVDKKTDTHFNSAMGKLDLDKNTFINIYNRRNGKINDTSYNRVAVVRFPGFEQLDTPEESELWGGVKGIRKADYAAYRSLFDFILPEWDVENTYSGASDSMDAPNFAALIKAFLKVANRLNAVMHDFEDVIEFSQTVFNDLDALETASNQLSRYTGVIPPLEGNTGEVAVNEQTALQPKSIGVPPAGLIKSGNDKFDAPVVTTAPTPVQQPQPTAPMYQQPQAAPQPQPTGAVPVWQQPQPTYPGAGYPGQPQQPYGGYPNQYPPQGYPQNPAYPTTPNPYGGYPTQQPVQQQALDPLQQWQRDFAATQQPVQTPAYPYGGYPPAQQQPQPLYGGYPNQYPPQGYPTNMPQQAYGGYPPQGGYGYGAPAPHQFKAAGHAAPAENKQPPQYYSHHK